MPPPEPDKDKPLPKPKPPKPKPKPPKPEPEPNTRSAPERDQTAAPYGTVPPDPLSCATDCSPDCVFYHLCPSPPPPVAPVHLRSSRLPTPLIALSASLLGVSVVLLAAITALVYDAKKTGGGIGLAGGGGGGGGGSCAVCLTEFRDGETLRLLPRCRHAFHRGCIDTWLRAHVNCPLCRSDVLGPAATATESGGGDTGSMPQADPVANTIAAAQQAAAPGDAILERQEEEEEAEQEDQGAPPHMEENRQEQSSSPDPLPPPRNVRRAASMDAAIVSTAAEVAALERLPEAAPEEEQSGGGGGGDKRGGAPGASCLKVSSSGRLSNLGAAERLPRSFFSRHCRARSSVLPL